MPGPLAKVKSGREVVFNLQLRQLTEYCEFGATLDEMLRDRLVCGVQDIRIQRRLLAELKLTLQQALDLALAIEAAEKDASELQKGDFQEGATPLNKVDTKDGKGSEINCYRCGGKHYPKSCHFKDARCYACGKLGNLSRVCQTKRKDNQTPPNKDKKSDTPQGTHLLADEVTTPGGEERARVHILCLPLAVNALHHTKPNRVSTGKP